MSVSDTLINQNKCHYYTHKSKFSYKYNKKRRKLRSFNKIWVQRQVRAHNNFI